MEYRVYKKLKHVYKFHEPSINQSTTGTIHGRIVYVTSWYLCVNVIVIPTWNHSFIQTSFSTLTQPILPYTTTKTIIIVGKGNRGRMNTLIGKYIWFLPLNHPKIVHFVCFEVFLWFYVRLMELLRVTLYKMELHPHFKNPRSALIFCE